MERSSLTLRSPVSCWRPSIRIRQMLSAVEKTERDGDGDYSGLIHNLEQLTENKPLASEPVVPLTTPAVAGLRITDSLEPAPFHRFQLLFRPWRLPLRR